MKDKISFLDSADFLCRSKNILSEDEYNEVEQIISSIESVSDDVEYSYSAAGGSLMVRCFMLIFSSSFSVYLGATLRYSRVLASTSFATGAASAPPLVR